MPDKKIKKTYNNTDFPDKNMKIISIPERISSIDSADDFPKVFHEDIEIKLFYEGSSTLIIGNETVVTHPGDIVVINPYEFHSTVNLGEERGKYHLLMIGLDFFGSQSSSLPDLRHIFIKERTSIQTLIRNNARLNEIITYIVFELEEKKDRYESVVCGLVLELFSLLLREYKGAMPLEHPSDKNIRYYEVIYPAIRKIRQDYASKVSVDELAAMCNVSKYHFCRIFKTVTSMSALNYQTEYRLRIADILLKNTNESISEIASLCGFDDVCYFSRCYKKHVGVSPKKNRAILSK